MSLHFVLVLKSEAIVITFCVGITLCSVTLSHFFHKIIHYFTFLQQEKSEHIFLCMFLRKQGIIVQTLRRKQKYPVTNVGAEKIKLTPLLVQRIK